MKVSYYINGIDFLTFSVKVSASTGLLSGLKMKEPLKVTWPDQHGEVVDLAAPRYEAREITLECFIKAASPTAFILAVQAFLAAFQKAGLQRLMIDVNDGVVTRKPLLFEVYLPDGTDLSKKWNASLMIGTFTLNLKEPEPVKRVYSFVAATGAMQVSITLTTTDPINIHWGDGTVQNDVITATGAVTHTYSTAGTYYLVLTGVIENITAVTTTATLVWTRL
jgi:hypothetical protein